MRLTESEKQKIKKIVARTLVGVSHELYLFGSRTDDQKKGGDIDLLLVTNEAEFLKVKDLKSALRFDLEDILGDQRVDLTIATPQSLEKDIFLQTISKDLVSI